MEPPATDRNKIQFTRASPWASEYPSVVLLVQLAAVQVCPLLPAIYLCVSSLGSGGVVLPDGFYTGPPPARAGKATSGGEQRRSCVQFVIKMNWWSLMETNGIHRRCFLLC